MTTIRLQKILAEAGYGSRRGCERYISDGRVRVNGEVAELGQRADPEEDVILLDGKPIKSQQKKRYILLNKPKGYLSSRRSQGGNPTVLELVDIPERVYPVGRLDLDSEGLVLLTNDGKLTNLLTHPRYGVEKEYQVTLWKAPDGVQLNQWREGVVLEDGYETEPAIVEKWERTGPGNILRVVIREGRKRHIRMTARALGLHVAELRRVRIGKLEIGDMATGTWRELLPAEVRTLFGTAQNSSNRQRM